MPAPTTTAVSFSATGVRRTACTAIETAGFLQLNEDQSKQLRALMPLYSKDYEAEVKKVRDALEAKYVEEVKKLLDDTQKAQFDALLTADKKYRDAVQKADDEYRTVLTNVIYKNQADPTIAERDLRFLPRDDNILLERYMSMQQGLTQKYQALRDEKGKAITAIYQQHKVDHSDLKAVQQWRETTTRLTKEAEAKFVEGCTALLNDEQKKELETAKQAMAAWQQATAAADEAYKKDVEAVVGPERAAQVQMQLRSRAFRRF